jgi:hypothetical protein
MTRCRRARPILLLGDSLDRVIPIRGSLTGQTINRPCDSAAEVYFSRRWRSRSNIYSKRRF